MRHLGVPAPAEIANRHHRTPATATTAARPVTFTRMAECVER
jgi:hypothetical protein